MRYILVYGWKRTERQGRRRRQYRNVTVSWRLLGEGDDFALCQTVRSVWSWESCNGDSMTVLIRPAHLLYSCGLYITMWMSTHVTEARVGNLEHKPREAARSLTKIQGEPLPELYKMVLSLEIANYTKRLHISSLAAVNLCDIVPRHHIWIYTAGSPLTQS